MKIFIQLLAIAVLSAGAAFAVHLWHPNRPALYFVPQQLEEGEVELAKALEWHREGRVVWVDARPRVKYEQGHVEGALLLNEQDDFNALLLEVWDTVQNNADKPFVVYCASETCAASKRVADLLMDRGLPDVWVLNGGVESLREAGLFVTP